jgi:hypothetical protein
MGTRARVFLYIGKKHRRMFTCVECSYTGTENKSGKKNSRVLFIAFEYWQVFQRYNYCTYMVLVNRKTRYSHRMAKQEWQDRTGRTG